jgi:3'-phosphoadenosine 5'-phosphosulfate sulfotransferase (PAPS reductase)/FAD synthetase
METTINFDSNRYAPSAPGFRLKPHLRAAKFGRPAITHLEALESESIHILREVAAECRNPALLFSGGKDSIVLLRLAEKAFRPARFSFPLLHIDTGHNFPEV